jgi:hypothetical protein
MNCQQVELLAEVFLTRNSAAVKAIAEDSKTALLTRHDSTNMGIITAVTSFFLSGTFTVVR